MSGELKIVGRLLSGAQILARLNALGAVGASFGDDVFAIKGSADATKKARFEVDGLTTATTRVFTLPNGDTTIAGLAIAQTFSAAQTFGSTIAVTGAATMASTLAVAGNLNLTGGASAAYRQETYVSSALTTAIPPDAAVGLSITNSNATVNNWSGIVFNQTGGAGFSGQSAGIFAKHTNQTGGARAVELHFFTTTGAVTGDRMTIAADGAVAIAGTTTLGGSGGTALNALNVIARAAIGEGTCSDADGRLLFDWNTTSNSATVNAFQGAAYRPFDVDASILKLQTGSGGSLTVGTAATVASFVGTTASTSPTTGALIVSGGVGIGGALNLSGLLTTQAAQAALFNNAAGAYVTFQHNGTSVGDIGPGNQIVGGGTSADFAVSSRAGSLLLGSNTTTRTTYTAAGSITHNAASGQQVNLAVNGSNLLSVTGTFVSVAQPVTITLAEASNTSPIASTVVMNGRATTTGSYFPIGLYVQQHASVAAGVVDSGYRMGIYAENFRNYNTGTADSTGSLATLYGAIIKAGHRNTNAVVPVTTTVHGLAIELHLGTGTVTSAAGLTISPDAMTGATVTTKYGMHIEACTGATTNYALYTNSGLVRFGGAVTLASTLQLGNTAVAGAVTPTHTMILKDASGTSYRVPCLV